MKNYRILFAVLFVFLLGWVVYSERFSNRGEVVKVSDNYQTLILDTNSIGPSVFELRTDVKIVAESSDNSGNGAVFAEINDAESAVVVESVADEPETPTSNALVVPPTAVGTLDVFGEVHNIWRTLSPKSLIFSGSEGRNMSMHSISGWGGWSSFAKPSYLDVGIVCPWRSTQNPGVTFANCWLFYDNRHENNGSVWAGTYEPMIPNGGSYLVMAKITSLNSNSDLWKSTTQTKGGYLYYNKNYRKYYVSNSSQPPLYSQSYDFENKGNFRGFSSGGVNWFWSIFPSNSSWSPYSPPSTYGVYVQHWNLAQSWLSSAVVPLSLLQNTNTKVISIGSGGGSFIVSADAVSVSSDSDSSESPVDGGSKVSASELADFKDENSISESD